MLITGCDKRNGEMNGIKWENYVLFSPKNCNVFGSKIEEVKVKKKVLEDWLASSGIDDIKFIENMDLEFNYDKYGNVKQIVEIAPLRKK